MKDKKEVKKIIEAIVPIIKGKNLTTIRSTISYLNSIVSDNSKVDLDSFNIDYYFDDGEM